MTPERWDKVAELFDSAVARDAEERAAFLDEACDGDASLREEVETLLASDGNGAVAIEEVASGVAAAWANQSDSDELVGQARLARAERLTSLATIGALPTPCLSRRPYSRW